MHPSNQLSVPSPSKQQKVPEKMPPMIPAHAASSADAAPRSTLMKLPVELRLVIAELALKSEKRLTWTWTRTGGKKAGTFLGLEELLPLTRTCRRLRDETKDVVWKVNTFVINPTYFPRDSEMSFLFSEHTRRFKAVIRTYAFFIKHAPEYATSSIRHIELSVHGSQVLSNVSKHAVITSLAMRTPNAEVHVILPKWFINGWYHNRSFLRIGDNIKFMMECLNAGKDTRSWRIFPRVDDSEYAPHRQLKMKKVLGSETYAKVADWMHHGI
ncbi:hypothetical protein IQ07DRAFT_636780 [Pyrenochaeta sp. DS3sAY3a]|nr:hypothetical protein IQ07DRAFT_636780 [Pyrenochaeta sp. DS3sAY3a]